MNNTDTPTEQAYTLQAGMVYSHHGEHYTIEAVTMMGLDHVILHTDKGAYSYPNDAWVALVTR